MFDIDTHDSTAPAPGHLEVVQRFMNLHEHVAGSGEGVPPSLEMLERFLRERGLLTEAEPFTPADRELALDLLAALHAMVRANVGEPLADEYVAVIDGLARRSGLRPRLGRDGPALVGSSRGVDGALGKLVAIAFLADLDGSWSHLKECAGANCDSVFFDRSKNHSGRWCSMSTCGNRAKVRAWRERHRANAQR